MWVKSADGKSINLVDRHTPHPTIAGEFFQLAISEKEAKKGISKEVPANKFFHGMIAIGTIAHGVAPRRTVKKGIKDEETS